MNKCRNSNLPKLLKIRVNLALTVKNQFNQADSSIVRTTKNSTKKVFVFFVTTIEP